MGFLMNSNELVYFAANEASTIKLGRILAHFAQKGDVLALFGTLGMGKSVLARAFVQELTQAEEVPSPTFTLVQSYEATDFEIYHFDLYRLKSPEEIFEIGLEEALYDGVCLIEWPERMGEYLPSSAFRVEITPKDEGREIKIINLSSSKQSRLSELKVIIDG